MKKAISAILIIALIANLVLFALGKISVLAFWITILAAAVFTFVFLPRM